QLLERLWKALRARVEARTQHHERPAGLPVRLERPVRGVGAREVHAVGLDGMAAEVAAAVHDDLELVHLMVMGRGDSGFALAAIAVDSGRRRIGLFAPGSEERRVDRAGAAGLVAAGLLDPVGRYLGEGDDLWHDGSFHGVNPAPATRL